MKQHFRKKVAKQTFGDFLTTFGTFFGDLWSSVRMCFKCDIDTIFWNKRDIRIYIYIYYQCSQKNNPKK